MLRFKRVFSVSSSFWINLKSILLPTHSYHVQQEGEGQEKYPKVEVEAVGEGALMRVHVPASRERRPHALPQYLKSLGTHLHLQVQPRAETLKLTELCGSSSNGIVCLRWHFHWGWQVNRDRFIKDGSVASRTRLLQWRSRVLACSSCAALRPNPCRVIGRVTFRRGNPLNARKNVHLKRKITAGLFLMRILNIAYIRGTHNVNARQ